MVARKNEHGSCHSAREGDLAEITRRHGLGPRRGRRLSGPGRQGFDTIATFGRHEADAWVAWTVAFLGVSVQVAGRLLDLGASRLARAVIIS